MFVPEIHKYCTAQKYLKRVFYQRAICSLPHNVIVKKLNSQVCNKIGYTRLCVRYIKHQEHHFSKKTANLATFSQQLATIVTGLAMQQATLTDSCVYTHVFVKYKYPRDVIYVTRFVKPILSTHKRHNVNYMQVFQLNL